MRLEKALKLLNDGIGREDSVATAMEEMILPRSKKECGTGSTP
jgi:hypothetical protein